MSRVLLSLFVCSLFFGLTTTEVSAQVAADNLVFNADFSETSSLGDPLGWLRGGWGENTRNHFFVNGDLTVAIEQTDYSNGDVKWYFEDIAIDGNKEFYVSYDYRTNVAGASVVARYTLPNGAFSYQSIGTMPTVTTGDEVVWGNTLHEFTAPGHATSFTLFFLVRGDMDCLTGCDQGNFLNLRNVYVNNLAEVVEGPYCGDGILQTSFGEECDDGNNADGDYCSATCQVESTDTSSGGSSSGGGSSSNVLVQNGSFEFGSETPDHWYLGGWGDNERTHVYPVDGYVGEQAVRVEVDQYVNGDAKWAFEDIETNGGVTYIYSDFYRADVPSELGLYYQTPTGPKYQFIAWLPASDQWKDVSHTFTVPADATSFTVFHYIYDNGWLEIDGVEVVVSGDSMHDGDEAEDTSTSTDNGTNDPYTPPAEWEDVTLTVQVDAPDHASTNLTVREGTEYSIGRLEMIADESDIVIYGDVAVRIETPGALPTDVLDGVTFIDWPLNNNRPFGTFVFDENSSSTGYYLFDLPEAIYLEEGEAEAFTIGAIFSDNFVSGQDVQLTISDKEMASWDALSAAYNTRVINLEAEYAGPVYTLQYQDIPVQTVEELNALINSLIGQIAALNGDVSTTTNSNPQTIEEFQILIDSLLAQIATLEEGQLSGEANLDYFNLVPDYENGGAQLMPGDEDVLIGELLIEFEDGDAEISRLDFSVRADGATSTAGVQPWEVFETLTLWVDGDLIDVVDADDIDDYLREELGTLRFSRLDLVATEDETLSIVIAASVKQDIPAAASTDWNLYATGLRFFDADGVATNEDSFQDLGLDGFIDFEIIEPEVAEISIRTSSNDPDATLLLVEEDDVSDDYTVGVFEIESEFGEIELETISVDVFVSGGNSGAVIDDMYLEIDGEEFYSSSASGAGSSATFNFDIDGDIYLDEDEEVDVEVVVIFDEASNYAVPQNVQVSVSGAGVSAVDEYGDDVEVVTGSYTGEMHTLSLEVDGVGIEVSGGYYYSTYAQAVTEGRYNLHEIEIDAIGGDATLQQVVVKLQTNGYDLSEVISDVRFAGEPAQPFGTVANGQSEIINDSTALYLFTLDDETVVDATGEVYEYFINDTRYTYVRSGPDDELSLDVVLQQPAVVDGELVITAGVGAEELQYWRASGEEVFAAEDITGDYDSSTRLLVFEGIVVQDLYKASSDAVDGVDVRMSFDMEAADQDYYVSNIATTNASTTGVQYTLYDSNGDEVVGGHTAYLTLERFEYSYDEEAGEYEVYTVIIEPDEAGYLPIWTPDTRQGRPGFYLNVVFDASLADGYYYADLNGVMYRVAPNQAAASEQEVFVRQENQWGRTETYQRFTVDGEEVLSPVTSQKG